MDKPFGDFWASKVTRPSAGEDGEDMGRKRQQNVSKINLRFNPTSFYYKKTILMRSPYTTPQPLSLFSFLHQEGADKFSFCKKNNDTQR